MLRGQLTHACDQALGAVDGFTWLTHTVDLDHVEKTLKIICVFESYSQKEASQINGQSQYLVNLIAQSLLKEGVRLFNPSVQIVLDSEEQCLDQHDGNWAKRLG